MGTRGVYGFYKNDIDKIAYCHMDSYPDGLGQDIVDFIRNTTVTEMNNIFNKIVLVDDNTSPIIVLNDNELQEGFNSLNYMGTFFDFWYKYLYEIQGDLNIYKQDTKYMLDAKNILLELDYSWAYIINLNSNKLEIYHVTDINNKNKFSPNRYTDNNKNSFPKLLIKFDLDNIPNDWMKLRPEFNPEYNHENDL